MTDEKVSQDLLLSEFLPEQMVKLPEHHPKRFPIPAYDAHNHLGRWFTKDWVIPDVPAFVAMLDEVNIRGVVNLDGPWGDELEVTLDRYDRAYPGRFATFVRPNWAETTTAGWGERIALSVRNAAKAGASGLKLWKDIGLRNKDEKGELFFLDDPRLAPVWAEVADAGIPILVHIADPVAFFRPLDATNERFEELVRHPDWHFYGPEFPSLERLLESLEKTVAANPRIQFIGAHVGCLAEDLAWVDRMISTYPNFNVDISARIAELGRQPRATRKLFLKHPDKVLFGTDIFPPKASDYHKYLRFLATDDECFPYSDHNPPPTGRWTISAIDLPEDVLTKVIATNAQRIIPAFGRGQK